MESLSKGSAESRSVETGNRIAVNIKSSLFETLASMVAHQQLSLEEVVQMSYKFGMEHGEILRKKSISNGTEVPPSGTSSANVRGKKPFNNRAPRVSKLPSNRDSQTPIGFSLSPASQQLQSALTGDGSRASPTHHNPTSSSGSGGRVNHDAEGNKLNSITYSIFPDGVPDSTAGNDGLLMGSSIGKFQGVEPTPSGFQAFVTLFGSQVNLGTFPTEEAAARVHDRVVIRTSGPKDCQSDRTLLNFPIESYAKDPLDNFTMYDTTLRKSMFGTAWSGFKEIDFSFLVMRTSNKQTGEPIATNKKRTASMIVGASSEAFPDESNSGKIFAKRNVKAVKKPHNASEQFYRMALFVAGEKDKYKNTVDDGKHVYIIERVVNGGWCHAIFPTTQLQVQQLQNPISGAVKVGTGGIGDDDMRIIMLRADVMNEFDSENIKSQMILLKDSELSNEDIAFRDKVARVLASRNVFQPLFDNEVSSAGNGELAMYSSVNIANLYKSSSNSGNTSNGIENSVRRVITDGLEEEIEGSSATEDASNEEKDESQVHPEPREDFSTESKRNRPDNGQDPIEVEEGASFSTEYADHNIGGMPVVNDILSSILEGSLSVEEVSTLELVTLEKVVNIILRDSSDDARHELLKESLTDLVDDGSIISDGRKYKVSKVESLKCCLINYIAELDF